MGHYASVVTTMTCTNHKEEHKMHDQIPAIVKEAREAAHKAASKYFNDVLGGRDALLCGFAYVYICDIKGNTKVGKALAAEGIKKGYSGAFEMYHPSGFPCQNIDTLPRLAFRV